MVFIRDTELVLRAAVELVNTLPETDPEGVDRLSTIAELDDFVVRHTYTGTRTRDDAEKDAVCGIRARVHELWAVDRASAVPLVNAMLRDGQALPQLVVHEGFDWHIHATSPEAPLATRMLAEMAMAFVDVIRSGEYNRVRICSAIDCRRVYIDYSKNSSKRYCDAGNCGNRMNVIAYRRRRALEGA